MVKASYAFYVWNLKSETRCINLTSQLDPPDHPYFSQGFHDAQHSDSPARLSRNISPYPANTYRCLSIFIHDASQDVDTGSRP